MNSNRVHNLSIYLVLGIVGIIISILFYYSWWVPYFLDDIAFANVSRYHGFWEAQKVWLETWNGRFASNFVITSYFNIFGLENSRNLSGVISLILMGVVSFDLAKRSKSTFSATFTFYLFATTLLILIFNTSELVSTISFLTASLTYTAGFFFSYFGVTSLLKTRDKSTFRYHLLTLILLSLAITSAETIIVCWLFVHSLFIGWLFIEKKLDIKHISTFLLILVVLMISLNMSGYINQFNSYGTSGHVGDIEFSLLNGTQVGLYEFGVDSLFLVLVSTFLLFSISKKIDVKRYRKFISLMLGTAAIIYVAVYTSGYLKTGWKAPSRVGNFVSYSLSAAWLFFLVTHVINSKKKHLKLQVVSSLVLPFFIVGYHCIRIDSQFPTVLNELRLNTTKTIYNFHQSIYRKLEQNAFKEIDVAIPVSIKFKKFNTTLPLEDIYYPQVDHWINVNLSQYFKANGVFFFYSPNSTWEEHMNNYLGDDRD